MILCDIYPPKLDLDKPILVPTNISTPITVKTTKSTNALKTYKLDHAMKIIKFEYNELMLLTYLTHQPYEEWVSVLTAKLLMGPFGTELIECISAEHYNGGIFHMKGMSIFF